MVREIALDTETTGLDPYSGHRVVEIGCVELVNHVRTGAVFHTYLNPQRDMPTEAERIHGLSTEFLQDKPLFKEVTAAFLEFIGDSKLVIHNAAFDLKFLNAELDALSQGLIDKARAIDTVIMARKKFPGQPASLDALCRRFGVDLSARDKHGALLDAELLSDVYLELLGGRQTALRLAEEKTLQMQENAATASRYPNLVKRRFAPSDAEMAAHTTMLEKLTDPIWKKLRRN
jgi:DNA polymerase-3 subunit epsilon